MSPHRMCILNVVLCTTLALALAAQTDAPQPGERIRIVAPWGTWEGVFVSADTAALRVRPSGGGSEIAVAPHSITRLGVVRGRRPATGRGARTGAVIGALVLGAAGAADAAMCDGDWCELSVMAVPAAIGLGALAGAGVGAIIGASMTEDAWVPVDLGSVRVGAIPIGRGVGIMVSTPF